ncbi:MAG: 3-isopropylmalate dehydratase large subunit [Candidatus Ranarchaeia archaeon]|jgi:homoaconitate hydratase family protein
MSKTVVEIILARASGQTKVNVDDRVWADIDLTTMRDFGGPNAILEYQKHFNHDPIAKPQKTVITFDLQVPAKTEKIANNQKICRDFAKRHSILRLFDVNEGIGNHVVFEEGYVQPGEIIIGTDSHMNLLGAFGAFSTGVGHTDIAVALKSGQLWYKVPPTLNFLLNGKPSSNVTSKDVILSIIGEVKGDGALYKAIEFGGSYVEDLQVHDAITIASMVTEMSGKIGFIPQNQFIESFLKARVPSLAKFPSPSKDASYENTRTFDLETLVPSIACPHSPDNVKAVDDVAGTPLDQVFLGSCTNGRFEDLKSAAQILKGNHIHTNTRMIVVPATREVAQRCVVEGIHDIFMKAGAVVCNPSCSLCTTNHHGVLAKGEVCLSTSNRNFPNKLGTGSEVYLASPLTAAYSALAGEIQGPGGK